MCGGGDGVEDAGDARPREAELRLGAVPRGRQGWGEAAREAYRQTRAAISTSTVIARIGCSDEQVGVSDDKLINIHTGLQSLYIAQSVRSLYLRSPRSAAPMQDGAAGAAQIEDNLGVKPDAAVDVGRTENDIRASRRCELPLSRVSSTDEAQLESGEISRVRQDLAVLTPHIRTRRRVSKTLPTATHTPID